LRKLLADFNTEYPKTSGQRDEQDFALKLKREIDKKLYVYIQSRDRQVSMALFFVQEFCIQLIFAFNL